MPATNAHFDPETLATLRSIFEEACRILPPDRCTPETKAYLARRILKRALRDGVNLGQLQQLRRYALQHAPDRRLPDDD
jgi:hypothetical protein